MMRYGALKAWVAGLLVFGHLAVFCACFALFVTAPIEFPDVLQLALSAIPVLGASAVLAFRDILANPAGWRMGRKVSGVFLAVTLTFPLMMYFLVFFCLSGIYFQWQSFGPENVKIAVAGIEGFFGIYVGAIATTFFGSNE